MTEEEVNTWTKSFSWAETKPEDDFARMKQLLLFFDGSPRTNTGSQLSSIALFAHVLDRWADLLRQEHLSYLLKGLHKQGRAILLAAFMHAGDERVRALLKNREIAESDIVEARKIVRPAYFDDPDKLDVTKSYHLDLCWGLYFGSGNPAFLQKILGRASWFTRPPGKGKKQKENKALGHAAVWSAGGMLHLPHVKKDVVAVFEANPKIKASFDKALESLNRFDHLDYGPPQ